MSQVYWTRFGLGIVAGLTCNIVRLGIVGIAVGTVLYAASFLIFLLVLHIPLGAKEYRRAYYAMGLGTYLAVWFTIWILLNTFTAS